VIPSAKGGTVAGAITPALKLHLEVNDMKKGIVFGITALAMGFLFAADNSYADRDATPTEEAAIYGALKAQGCTVTDDIEVESVSGVYVVDEDEPRGLLPGIYKTEALCFDGEKYDIKMDHHLNILSKEED